MSAKDGILHAMKWTVKDEFNHKMEVSNAVDGCVIFYPHNQAVQISYEDLEKLIENLKKPNSNYIRKNSREEKTEKVDVNGWTYTDENGTRDYILKNPQVEEIRHYTEIDPKDFVNEARNIAAEHDPYVQDELMKRLVVAEKPVEYSAHDLEIACQEFADNYHGTYDTETKTIRVPIDEIIDDCADKVEQFNIPFRYISKDLKDYVYIIQL